VLNIIRSFSIIIIGLAAGYAFNRAIEAGAIHINSAETERLRIGLQRFALLFINPVSFCGAVWSLDLSHPRYFLLPIVGLSALALGLGLGFAGSRILRLPPERAGVYTTCASFTNIGNIGGLVAFVTLGEGAFGLVPFFKLGEELWYYSVLFPLARAYGAKANPGLAAVGSDGGRAEGPATGVLRVLRDPFFLVAIAGISIGLGLNAAGLPRPAFYAPLNSVLVPISSLTLLFAVGMRMRFRIKREYWKAAALIVAGKALAVPCAAAAIATAFGLGSVSGGLGLKVVVVLTAMPIGFLGLVPPTLFRLDLDFANALWLVSNGALIFIVPALAAILPFLG
jgi:predicted permease